MKTIYILISFVSFGIMSSQNSNYKSNNDSIRLKKFSCEEGLNQAKNDFSNGIYNCFSYGLIIETNPKLNNFINEYRKNKYGIITKNAGCVITPYSKCYSETMEKLVLNKFGEDIFEKSRIEAERLYNEKEIEKK